MKYLFCALFLLFSATTAFAEDTPKSYEQMTLQELQAVDTASLDKAAKKSHKKALKAAKKAEKKLLRAEKKRLKAEAAAKKAREKALEKKLKKVTKVYSKTNAVNDEFVAEKQVLGPQYFVEQKGNLFGPTPKYSLISVIHTNGVHTLQLFIHTAESVNGLDLDWLSFKGLSPETHARKTGLWRDYYRANLSGGIERDVVPIKQYADPCSNITCYFNEDFYVQLSVNDLTAALTEKRELALRIMSERGKPIVVRIPLTYLVGYSRKLADIHPQFTGIKKLAAEGQDYILNNS